LYYDKRAASAQILLEKGKEDGFRCLGQRGKYFFEVPFLMEQAKKQGQSFSKELIEK
jgi:hypothetical protein